MVRDTTLAHKGLAPYKLSYLTVSKDAHAGHTHEIKSIENAFYLNVTE
jgi:hypothetical protein